MKIVEIFKTIQGEGKNIGKPALFIRLYGCIVRCKNCDTKHSWNNTKYCEDIDVEKLRYMIKQSGMNYIVITGGEPLIQSEELVKLMSNFDDKIFEIETSGYYPPIISNNIIYSVSPKLSFNKSKYTFDNLYFYRNAANFKFVVRNKEDLEEVKSIVNLTGIDNERVMIMAEGRNSNILTKRERWLFEYLPYYYPEWKLTTRLHIHLYNGKKGV